MMSLSIFIRTPISLVISLSLLPRKEKNALVPISFLLKRVAPPSGRLECLHFLKKYNKGSVARWHGG